MTSKFSNIRGWGGGGWGGGVGFFLCVCGWGRRVTSKIYCHLDLAKSLHLYLPSLLLEIYL